MCTNEHRVLICLYRVLLSLFPVKGKRPHPPSAQPPHSSPLSQRGGEGRGEGDPSNVKQRNAFLLGWLKVVYNGPV